MSEEPLFDLKDPSTEFGSTRYLLGFLDAINIMLGYLENNKDTLNYGNCREELIKYHVAIRKIRNKKVKEIIEVALLED